MQIPVANRRTKLSSLSLRYVYLPCFHQPAIDLISKWGRAIHAIQVKSGTVGPNAKTIQWRTRAYKGLYSEDDCSYFGLVLIPHDEIWWIPYNVLKGKRWFVPISSQTFGLNIEGTQTGLKSAKSVIKTVIEFLNFKKTLQTKGEVSVVIRLKKQNSTLVIGTSSIALGRGG